MKYFVIMRMEYVRRIYCHYLWVPIPPKSFFPILFSSNRIFFNFPLQFYGNVYYVKQKIYYSLAIGRNNTSRSYSELVLYPFAAVRRYQALLFTLADDDNRLHELADQIQSLNALLQMSRVF